MTSGRGIIHRGVGARMARLPIYLKRTLLTFVVTIALLVLTLNVGTGNANASTSGFSATVPARFSEGAPVPPSPTASIQTWQTWSSAQSEWIRSIPYAQAFASEGLTLVELGFNQIQSVPELGLPPGVNETTAWWVVRPSTASSTQNQNSSTALPASSASTCDIASGPGSVCIGTNGTYPATISATYEYLGAGSTTGHVELGAGACPGSLAQNSPDTVLEYGWSVGTDISTTSSTTWSSTFWDETSSGYADWGTACAVY